jgi:eukaryotic-like serine/threonine-protein kinase
MDFDIKDVIDNRFELLEMIGEGNHGVVFRAMDRESGVEVAVKCLQPEMALERGVRARMEREARAMGALSGTSAVRIIAFNETPDGGLYLTMELLRGKNLDAYLREIEAGGQRLSSAQLFDLLDPIVDTLQAAHAMGIIHRDLKPANIFVLDAAGGSGRGGVRLLDFGLAKDLKADSLTKDGAITGSPSYIAPEGWAGKPHELDHRIDVYTLGVVIFRALGGRVPFHSKKMYDLILSVTRGPRPSLLALRPDLPAGIDQWVEKALASSRDDRFQSVRSLWENLGELHDRTR